MGPWSILTLIAIAAISTDAGRNYVKKLVKVGVRAGYRAKESASELNSKARAYRDELIAEIKSEQEEPVSD